MRRMPGNAFPSLQPRLERIFRSPFERGDAPRNAPVTLTVLRAENLILILGAAIAAAVAVAGSLPARAGDHPSAPRVDPISATVAYVIDGDTVRVDPIVWGDGRTFVRVRFETFSAPELGKRAKCAAEARLGERAKSRMAELIRPGDLVVLHGARPGRYAGRLIADVRLSNNQDPALFLLREGLAAPFGRGGRSDWCDR